MTDYNDRHCNRCEIQDAMTVIVICIFCMTTTVVQGIRNATLFIYMNTRDYKPFAEGGYYHIYNRGNGQQEIFLDTSDYTFFLYRLKEALYPKTIPTSLQAASSKRRKSLPSDAFTLLVYCLMPNHFHFLKNLKLKLKINSTPPYLT